MRIRPRQQLLDLWQAVLSCSYRDETWTWGGRDGSNSISDAEQLLCLLYPATELEAFTLEQPDDMAADTRDALAAFGEETRVGGVLVGLLEQYLARYTGPDGEPVFACGGYIRNAENGPLTDEQAELEIVDSYSMSLSLCIAALRFLRGFQRFVGGEVRREARQLDAHVPAVIAAVSSRLTAAMAGLVRSFVIHTPEPKSAAGQAILQMINQENAPADEVIRRLSSQLERLRVQAANEIRLSQSAEVDVADDQRLFECGWGWGIVRTAEPIDFAGRVGRSPGHAEPRPFLYFTAVALDGIIDLSSQRIRELDLLTDEQRRLADALQLRFELARNYWSTVARFGGGGWPLEDIPWRTSDGEESDYFSLTVTAILIQDLVYRDSTEDLARTVAVFDQLARRGRVTSRLTDGDQAASLHYPGVRLSLAGSEKFGDGAPLHWYVPDFVTMMLKRCLQARRLRTDVDIRDRLTALAEAAMDHLDDRLLRTGPGEGLWDDPAVLFGPDHRVPEGPSWYITERAMECLVIAYGTFREPPLAPATMVARALDLMSEAEHLLNQEVLEVEGSDLSPRHSAVNRIRQSLDRARTVLRERPGTAYSLATRALIELDELAYARQDATR